MTAAPGPAPHVELTCCGVADSRMMQTALVSCRGQLHIISAAPLFCTSQQNNFDFENAQLSVQLPVGVLRTCTVSPHRSTA